MITFKVIAADTDSIKLIKEDQSPFTEEDMDLLLFNMNKRTPKGILLEPDGLYDQIIFVKAKNYVTKIENKVKIMGSALKASMKEPALKTLLGDVLFSLLESGDKYIPRIYNDCVSEIGDIQDIDRWSSKKTVTKAVLDPQRTNEQRVLDAIGNKKVQEGDKVHMFFKTKTELCLAENFDGEYDRDKLYEKAFKTIKIFETILDMDNFKNYKLKRNKELRP